MIKLPKLTTFGTAFSCLFLPFILNCLNLFSQCNPDVTPPTFSNCPLPITVNADFLQCAKIVNYPMPVATDNCATTNLTFDQNGSFLDYEEKGFRIHDINHPEIPQKVYIFNGVASSQSAFAWHVITSITNQPFTPIAVDFRKGIPGSQNIICFGTTASGTNVNTTFALSNVFTRFTFPATFKNLISLTLNLEAGVNVPQAQYDNLTFEKPVTVTQVSGQVSGGAFPAGVTINKFKATDAAGNFSFCEFAVNVIDNTPPQFITPLFSLDRSVECNDAAGLAAALALYPEAVNCYDYPAAHLLSDVTTASGLCQNAYTRVRTWNFTSSNNVVSDNFVQTISVTDNTWPVISNLPGALDRVVQCGNASGLSAALALAPSATDNCTAVILPFLINDVSTPIPGCPSGYTRIRTWNFGDNCGNVSPNYRQVISVTDDIQPTFTTPPNITIPFTSVCGYDASIAKTGDVTDEHDNCSVNLNATYSDYLEECGSIVKIHRYWSLYDNCGNNAYYGQQLILVTDNNTKYVVYASKEAKFGEANKILGDVGVSDANGKAEFRKRDTLNPYTVRAKKINVQTPSLISNQVLAPATGGPNPPKQLYVAKPLTGNYTATLNGTIPAGNYKNLTIKKGMSVTINGSDYGKVTIEDGATVFFMSTDINMEELSVAKGQGNNMTRIFFSGCTGVKIKDKVTIGGNCDLNYLFGPKVNFYLNDTKNDNETFLVKGSNSRINVNIIIPNGTLKIDGDASNCKMNGFFLVEKLHSEGKNITWETREDCPGILRTDPATTSRTADTEITEQPAIDTATTAATPVNQVKTIAVTPLKFTGDFEVKVSPNPTTTEFTITVNSKSDLPVSVSLKDVLGKSLSTLNVKQGVLTKIGKSLRPATYFVEVRQGENKKVIKLIKLK